jgi:hypothetical protein
MEINETLFGIINSNVILSKSGGSTGSLWLIDFDNKTSLYIYCTWRIEHNDNILTTSNDDTTPITGLLTKTVRELEGKKLIAFDLSKQYDLTLKFEDDYCVKIFCDISYSETENGGTYDTNWDLSMPDNDLVISISNYFKINKSKYYS